MPVLDWIGKEKVVNHHLDVPYKVLERVYSYDENGKHAEDNGSENMIIHGDNLEALKSLLPQYEGMINCIYIDPPYNTGNEKWVYNDNVNDPRIKKWLGEVVGTEEEDFSRHDKWLCMMYPRLKLLHKLLSNDGVIFISIDDNEQAYLKYLMDEIFGRNNFVNTISVNIKNIAGASGGGEDKKLKKNIEYIHIYAKNYEELPLFESVYDYVPIAELVEKYRQEGKSWKYTSVLVNSGDKKYIGSTVDGDGNEIKIYSRENAIIKSIGAIIKEENIDEETAYKKYANYIFQTAMPQSSIRPRVMEKVAELGYKNDLYSIEYVPKTGRNRGRLYEQFYKGENFRLFAWLKDVSEEIDGVLYKKELQGTYWDFVGETKNLTKEGNMPFPNGKKPIKMLEQIIKMCTNDNDIILDSFAGSGSTAHAVLSLNKKENSNRKFITIELMDYAETTTAERIKNAIKEFEKGNYSFYELGEQILINNELNENIDIQKIREYVYFMETKCKAIKDKEEQNLLGLNNDTAYYFYYIKNKATTLNRDFLATIKTKAKRYVIYADICTLSEKELDKYNITFKKIPRDISKL